MPKNRQKQVKMLHKCELMLQNVCYMKDDTFVHKYLENDTYICTENEQYANQKKPHIN